MHVPSTPHVSQETLEFEIQRHFDLREQDAFPMKVGADPDEAWAMALWSPSHQFFNEGRGWTPTNGTSATSTTHDPLFGRLECCIPVAVQPI